MTANTPPDNKPEGATTTTPATRQGRVPGRPLRASGTPGVRDSRADDAAARTLRPKTVRVKKARGKTNAQVRWLQRQLNDPYVQAARLQGWRSRAAFKLLEMDDKYGLLKPGMKVVDLGAAPGGWAQVAAKRAPGARIVGVDLLPVEPVEGASFIEGDFMDDTMPAQLEALLDGKADLVMSDMAPNTTGHPGTDHIRIMGLTENALHFARDITAPGGAFIAKVFQGGAEKTMLDQLKRDYATVRHVKPPASRKESRELYVVATGFRGQPNPS
ncbi:RlmE family RNA methyltransferase [Formicincola oecophyllae]|uniref:Ribosomal RNA large subunit methyltransferase E n=1 Tax=Formicincola oecophyllae TaxID=2558361 RepID=A0A4Y6U9T6_9PROT|nr:RlmE family RNA methyltransferase [Formicincola oecophyllae]QDH13974.1 RlmE family RNA methyltransferase [Formicincola oecophyllae]